MPEVTVTVGGRPFEVACQPGEELFLRAAAKALDTEARVLLDQIGRMPESRMLLMAGLMIADRVAGMEDQARAQTTRLAQVEAELAELKARPAPAPERVEVPVLPRSVTDSLAEMAARAEALATALAERLPPVAADAPAEG
ncbi:MAG: cell division protein ZapA [Rhodobacteraceae bacterium]|nr:cell division protein ZapA [Paracoccaceae bacterium]